MAIEKYQLIVDGLVAKTADQELDWKEAPKADTFQISFSNYSISLSEITVQGPNFFSAPHTVRIISVRDPDGQEIDSFTDAELPDNYSKITSELYRSVRRQVLGVDRALDEILSELR